MNSLGRLFILVEGQVDDAKYLSALLKGIFNLNVIEDSTRDSYISFDAYNDFQILSDTQKNNVIIIKAAPKPQLHAALKLFDEYTVIPRYYNIIDSHLFNTVLIFDKDIDSGNSNNEIKVFLKRYKDILDLGLLLVSYPCIESLMISCKNQTIEYFTNSQEAKRVWRSIGDLSISFIELKNSVNYTLDILSTFGYSDDIDTLLTKLDEIDFKVEQDYVSKSKWIKMSLVTLIFVVLGLI